MEPARQQRRAPDERSFEGLYRRHRAEVYRALLRELGNREDAEDVTQTAFLDAYRALARGTEPDRPRAWLLTIAENARRRRFRALGRAPEQAELAREPAAAEAEVTAGDLREGLDRLPENQRGALVLREIGGFSYAEIGARLGLSVASVQMLLFRARRSLRAELEADVATRRRGAWLPWPWVGWVTGGGGAAGVLPRAAGLVAAGVGAAALTGPGAPARHEQQAHSAQRPARVAPVAVADNAEPRAFLAPRVRARASASAPPLHVVRPAPPAPAIAPPAPASAPPRVTPAPPAPPPVAPPAAAPPIPEPAAPAPADPAAPPLPLPAIEVPTVQAPTPAVELPVPTLSPTIPPVPAPPAGPGDLGGAALPGLPTS